MAEFVKKKIAEKLAKFTKDLKPSDISLSFLRGKGELRNVELNSELITDALRLPPWISVSRVFCDSVRVSVPFTDLNKSPILCTLGQVEINVSTCGDEETYRKETERIKMKRRNSSSYGFIERVVDGMEIQVRGVVVKFTNPIFNAQLELTEVHMESTTPSWQPANLTHCRIKCEEEGSIIIYKRATWSSLKLEGWSTDVEKDISQLRLITNVTDIRVTVKRRLSDCCVLATRISVHLGDLIWVLTQSQLKAASKLAQSLVEAAVRSAQYEREKLHDSKESLASVDSAVTTSDEDASAAMGKHKSKRHSAQKDNKDLTRERYLRKKVLEYQMGITSLPTHEVIQDSFHLRTGNVDLQLCDEKSSLLLQLKRLLIDVYFNQEAMSGRRHWNKANQPLMDNVDWSANLVREASRVQHMDLPSISTYKLRERGIIIRLADFQVRAIQTETDEEKLLPIITSDKETFKIPDNVDNPSFQCGITLYNYPPELGHKFLVPRPNIFVYLSPIHINFHQESCLWLVEFAHGVAQTVNLNLLLAAHTEGKVFMEQLKAKQTMKQLPGFDVKLSIPYSKVTLPVTQKYTDGRPRALQVETGGVLLNNHTLVSLFDSSEFLDAWRKVSMGWLPNSTEQFPHAATDPSPIPNNLRELIDTEIRQRNKKKSSNSGSGHSPSKHGRVRESPNMPLPKKSVAEASRKASLHQLKLAALECWEIGTRCVTISFVEDLSHQATLYTDDFVTDFPLQLWFFQPKKMALLMEPSSPPPAPLPALHLLVHIPVPLQVQLKRLQFLFLLRLKDSFQGFRKSLMGFLSIDSLIESQQKEAFQIRQETDEEETGGEEKDIKEKLTAAILKRKRTTSGSDSKAVSTFTTSLMLEGARVFLELPPALPETVGSSGDQSTTGLEKPSSRVKATESHPSSQVEATRMEPRPPQPHPSSEVKAVKTEEASPSSQPSPAAQVQAVVHPLQPESKDGSLASLSTAGVPSTTVQPSIQSSASVVSLPQLQTAPQPPGLPITGRSQSSFSLSGAHGTALSGGRNLGASEELLTTAQPPSYSNTPSESSFPLQSDSSSVCADLDGSTSDSPTEVEDSVNSVKRLSPVEKHAITRTGISHVRNASATLPAASSTNTPPLKSSTTSLPLACSSAATGNSGAISPLKNDAADTGKTQRHPSPAYHLPPAADPSRISPQPPPSGTASVHPSPPPVKVGPPTPLSPSRVHPRYTLHAVTGPIRLMLHMGMTGIASKVTVDTVTLHELTQKELKQKLSQSPTRLETHPETSENFLPVVMLRLEMGKMAHGYFLEADHKPDSVTFLKICGLRTSLVLKNIMACRNFFNDEVESNQPMAIQLRVMETQFILRDSLSHSFTHPRTFTVNVPDIFINRGPRAEGTNLILPDTAAVTSPLSPASSSEFAPDHSGIVNKALLVSDEVVTVGSVANGTIADSGVLGSYKTFMTKFSGHLQQTKAAGLEKVMSLLLELQEVLRSTVTPLPSYTEAISCDFYSNLTSASPHPTVGSLQAEVERLRRENQELVENLKSSRTECKEQEKECSDITSQLVDAKVRLASAHLVLEQQQNKMEQLFNENFNLKDTLRRGSFSPS